MQLAKTMVVLPNLIVRCAISQGGERTKTAEEVAENEKARLERLETERLKRMRGMGGGSDEDEAGGEDGAGGGYRARRQKRKRDEAAAVEHGPSGGASHYAIWKCYQSTSKVCVSSITG